LRLACQLARSFGAECTDYDDGFDLDPSGLRGTTVPAQELGEIALLALALGLSAEGDSVLSDAGVLDALYPGFVDSLVSLGAGIQREEAP
jgi:hypothetical protein